MTSFKTVLYNEKKNHRRNHILEGNRKVVFQGADPGTIVLYFKKHQQENLQGNPSINNRFSEVMMSRLESMGIETHFIRSLNMYEQLVHACSPLSFNINVHHVAVDDFADRFELDQLTFLPEIVTEFQTGSKNKPSTLSSKHIESFGLADATEIEEIELASQRIFDIIAGQCLAVNLRLLNLKLKFGRYDIDEYEEDSRIMLIDEISPDRMSLLDLETNQRFDPFSCQNIDENNRNIYQKIAQRFKIINN